MKMDLTILISDSLVRIGMNGVLVLSMLPTLACGVGLNFGLPVGVIAGLIGAVMSMNWNLQGFAGFFAAIAIALPVAMVAGYIYALVLERVQGQEMMVGTYVGFYSIGDVHVLALGTYQEPGHDIRYWRAGGAPVHTHS